MTPEVGTSHWPPTSQILPLAVENLPANIHSSYVAGQKSILRSSDPDSVTAAVGFLAGGSFGLDLHLQNRGFGDAHQLAVLVDPESSWITIDTPPILLDTLGARGDTILRVTGTIDAGVPHGGTADLFVVFSDPDGYYRRDTITFFLGPPFLLFEDDAESGTSAWTTGGTWDTSSQRGPSAGTGAGTVILSGRS